MTPGSPLAHHTRGGRLGFLALCGAFAVSCSEPYEADSQLWPAEMGGPTTGGSSSPDTGGSAAGMAPVVTAGGNETGGTTASTTGGSLGASGSSPNAAGGDSGGNGTGGSSGSLGGGGSGSGGGASGSGGASVSGGATGSGGAGGSGAGGSASSSNCSLSVKVTTASAGGKYAPRNVGAIWVADEAGNFVRSLEVWAQRRVSNLSTWNSATSKAGAAGSRVDIVSQATLTSHKAHTATWNCQDFKKLPVPDGTYRVYFEIADGSRASRFEAFTKGPAAATLTPADNNNFKALELSFKP